MSTFVYKYESTKMFFERYQEFLIRKKWKQQQWIKEITPKFAVLIFYSFLFKIILANSALQPKQFIWVSEFRLRLQKFLAALLINKKMKYQTNRTLL